MPDVDSPRPWSRREPWPARIERMLERIERKVDYSMADLTALNAAVDALVAEDASVVAALDDLKSKITDPNLQAEIDAISAKVTGVSGDLQAAVERDDPPPPPAG